MGKYPVGEGWQELVAELDRKVHDLDPDVTVTTIKEKFGGLRYYAYYRREVANEIEALINEAGEKSLTICEDCGAEGEPRNTGWILTLCEECYGRIRSKREASGLET